MSPSQQHPNFHRLVPRVGQLRGHHRAFSELDKRHRVGSGVFLPTGRFINGRVLKSLAFPAEGVEGLCLTAAGWVNIAGWKNFIITIRAILR